MTAGTTAKTKAEAAEKAGKAYTAALADQVFALDDFNTLIPKYTLISGNGSTWKDGNTDPLVLISDGEMKWFTGLMIDGQLVDPSNYQVRKGSTEVYLNPDYLDTLKDGQHTVRFLYKYGITVDGTFTTAAKTEVTQNVKNNAAEAATTATAVTAGNTNSSNTATTTVGAAQTGDTSNAAIPAAAMAGSGLMAAFLAIFDRRRRHA